MKKLSNWFAPGLFSVACVAALIASLSFAQEKEPPKKDAPGLPADFKLPPGWTAADLQACMLAGTPGDMQKFLASGKGDWSGKSTMWMYPGAEPTVSDMTSTVTTIMEGRFTKVEVKGDMPGMGPYHGIGVYGYDNVGKKFVSTWIDNHSTGMMQGEGELSKDQKTLTWNYNFSCPLTQKPAVMKEVETIVSEKERKLEMWGNDPKSGKNFKMMQIELTRK
jgi:hypothetical protein